MRVSKKQIVDGLAAYILNELAPKMGRETLYPEDFTAIRDKIGGADNA